MPSKTTSVRFNVDEKEEWANWARSQSMTFNKWIVRACRGQYEMERAETKERDEAIAERERIQKAAYPLGDEKCRHVVQGQWCYRCNKKRW